MRIGQPTKEFAKLHALEPERFANADLLEYAHVRPFDADGKEAERLLLLAIVDARDDGLPMVVGFTIGNEESPGSIVGDAMLAVAVLALFDHIERQKFHLVNLNLYQRVRLDLVNFLRLLLARILEH